jgi:predicted lipoprotein with Yx(FWY)xxD motif
VAVDVSQTGLGSVLVDGTGFTLYAFGSDTTGTPTCVDATCTAAWPPVTGTGIAVATGAGASTGLFKLVARPDGTQQLSVGGRPVYRYSGDTKPGDTNGQGVGGQWHALNPDGTLVGG